MFDRENLRNRTIQTLIRGGVNKSLSKLSKMRPSFTRKLIDILEMSPFKLYPHRARINLTSNCNSKCKFCSYWEKEDKNELKLSEFIKLFLEMNEVSIKDVRFSGGEPLYRDDIKEILKNARSYFNKVHLDTNGLLLPKKFHILPSYIDGITVSIDGLKSHHDEQRGIEGAFDLAMEGINKLRREVKERDENVNISIRTTVTKDNYMDVPELLKICKRKNINWNISLLDNIESFEKTDLSENLFKGQSMDGLINKIRKSEATSYSDWELMFIKNHLERRDKKGTPCVLGYKRICIMSKGDVYPGCTDMKRLGNIRERSIKDILKDEEYKRERMKMYNLQCRKCACRRV